MTERELLGGPFDIPPSEPGALMALATKPHAPTGGEWAAAVRKAEPDELIAAVAALRDGGGTTGARLGALREAARAMLETKLTEQMVERMEALEKQASRLTLVGWVVTAVVALAAAILPTCMGRGI